ncbi:hypothetical protein [Trichoplusia ni ascovirus 2c]|uniref:hypothetical protein n=1 Tax=Trichoplusia ni ascovirus 2c TaxID=328615 RepID=UPI0000E441F8|nr:hypothetical protein TNAV2c_gp032 [Trichoplusia ni ascovirus 2c]ABF70549.1 hypothetical protein [Trichoplusia ni ascovirus 2c]
MDQRVFSEFTYNIYGYRRSLQNRSHEDLMSLLSEPSRAPNHWYRLPMVMVINGGRNIPPQLTHISINVGDDGDQVFDEIARNVKRCNLLQCIMDIIQKSLVRYDMLPDVISYLYSIDNILNNLTNTTTTPRGVVISYRYIQPDDFNYSVYERSRTEIPMCVTLSYFSSIINSIRRTINSLPLGLYRYAHQLLCAEMDRGFIYGNSDAISTIINDAMVVDHQALHLAIISARDNIPTSVDIPDEESPIRRERSRTGTYSPRRSRSNTLVLDRILGRRSRTTRSRTGTYSPRRSRSNTLILDTRPYSSIFNRYPNRTRILETPTRENGDSSISSVTSASPSSSSIISIEDDDSDYNDSDDDDQISIFDYVRRSQSPIPGPSNRQTRGRDRASIRIIRDYSKSSSPDINNSSRNLKPSVVRQLRSSAVSKTWLENSKEFYPDKECIICKDKDANCTLVPCGHRITCEDCTRPLENCPVCRNNITGDFHRV